MEKRKILKQVIIGIIVILAIVLAYFIFYVARNFSLINKGTEKNQITLDLTKKINILLLGTDARTVDEGARSDVIILVNLNPTTKKATLISIPRDTYVEVPGHGYDKINATFNKDYFEDGGVELTIKTIENLLGLPEKTIELYAVVDFEGFKKVIDALGGVTIDVKERMYYHSWTGDVKIDLQPGVQHLDGEKALQYARFRYDEYGDYYVDEEGNIHGRVSRQEELLKAIIDQTKDIRNLWRLPQVAKAIGEAINTNITPSQITKLGLLFKNISSSDLTVIPFPGKADYINEISYIVPDFEKLKEIGPINFSSEIK